MGISSKTLRLYIGCALILSLNDFSLRTNESGVPKSHLDENGNLIPANPEGSTTIRQHIEGHPRNIKGDSPHTSTSDLSNGTTIPRDYGAQEIEVETGRLQRDINAGRVEGVVITPPRQVQEQLQLDLNAAQRRFNSNPSASNQDRVNRARNRLNNATRDNECIITGCVPAEYVRPPRPVSPGD